MISARGLSPGGTGHQLSVILAQNILSLRSSEKSNGEANEKVAILSLTQGLATASLGILARQELPFPRPNYTNNT